MKDSQEHEDKDEVDFCVECRERPVETPEGFCSICYDDYFSGHDRDD